MDRTELLKLRNEFGATQTEMADAMGVPLRTYQDIETGVSKFRPIHERAALEAYRTLKMLRPAPFEGKALLRSGEYDRNGQPTNSGGAHLLDSQSEAMREMMTLLHAYQITGFNDEHGYWWGRNNDADYRIERFWIERFSK